MRQKSENTKGNRQAWGGVGWGGVGWGSRSRQVPLWREKRRQGWDGDKPGDRDRLAAARDFVFKVVRDKVQQGFWFESSLSS